MTMKQKGLLVLAGVFCCFLVMATTSRAAENTKVGYIDINRLVNDSNMGKTASVELKKLRKEKESRLQKKKDQIDKLDALVNNSKSKLDEAERLNKARKLSDLKTEYKRMTEDASQAIKWKNDDIVRHILEKAIPIIQRIAQKDGYTMIVRNPDALIYVSKSVDITDSVIKQLNKESHK